MTSVAAQFMLESEWVMATIGALTVMFSALAWFVKALVNQSESRIENSIGKVAPRVIVTGRPVSSQTLPDSVSGEAVGLRMIAIPGLRRFGPKRLLRTTSPVLGAPVEPKLTVAPPPSR